MALFKTEENRVRCGKCGTEFDLNKNKNGCPLCGFGNSTSTLEKGTTFIPVGKQGKDEKVSQNFLIEPVEEYFKVPPEISLKRGEVIIDKETQIWGSWLMFNDFFALKFIARTLAWKMSKEKKDCIVLQDLMNQFLDLVKTYNLSKFKGFPNLSKDSKGSRLVNHFLKTGAKMGFFKVRSKNLRFEDIWKENWNKIEIALTKEGLEFARLKNAILDQNKKEQILSEEERVWLMNYLKKIDREGYKEYSRLKEVFEHIKSGHNGNKDLWNWFENDKRFQDYIRSRSRRAKEDPKIFDKQLSNYAKTFASTKISLLRELGIIKNKRNDYSIIGELR